MRILFEKGWASKWFTKNEPQKRFYAIEKRGWMRPALVKVVVTRVRKDECVYYRESPAKASLAKVRPLYSGTFPGGLYTSEAEARAILKHGQTNLWTWVFGALLEVRPLGRRFTNC